MDRTRQDDVDASIRTQQCFSCIHSVTRESRTVKYEIPGLKSVQTSSLTSSLCNIK